MRTIFWINQCITCLKTKNENFYHKNSSPKMWVATHEKSINIVNQPSKNDYILGCTFVRTNPIKMESSNFC